METPPICIAHIPFLFLFYLPLFITIDNRLPPNYYFFLEIGHVLKYIATSNFLLLPAKVISDERTILYLAKTVGTKL